jgi:ferritin
MIKFQSLTTQEVGIIMPRMTDELNARYFYESAWAWCRLNGYMKAAKWFKKQAKDESGHYKMLVKILVDWNVPVILPAIAAPIFDFGSLLDILEKAYIIEYDLGFKYNADAITMFPINQMLYRKLFITFIHIQKNETEDRKRMLENAYKWIVNDPNLMEFEENIF